MTKETIERAIAQVEPRAVRTGFSPVTYEIMLPKGVALVMYAP
jgi:transcriptional/translational regulatory protein YebC/TACO1